MYAVSLAAGKRSHFFLLVRPGKVEARHIRARIDLPAADRDDVLAVGNHLPDVFLRIQRVAALIDVGQFDGLADADGSRVGAFLTGDHTKQRGFARAVGADDTDNAAGRQGKRHAFDKQFFSVALGNFVGFNDHVAQAGAGRNKELARAGFLFQIFTQQFFIRLDARLGFGMPTFWGHVDPFQFTLQGFDSGAFRFLLVLQPVLFLLQPGRIIALPGNALVAVQFQDPARDVVEEVAVVRDGDDGPLVFLQVVFQPSYGFGVQMVGRLVQQQNIGFLQEQAAERNAAPLSAGQNFYGRIARRAAQSVHGHLQARVDVPGVERVHFFLQRGLPVHQFGHGLLGHFFGEFFVDGVVFVDHIHGGLNALFHNPADGFVFVQPRLLLQIAHRVSGGKNGLPQKFIIHTGENFQKRAFARTVQTDHADLRAVEIRKINVLQHGFLVVNLADSDHGVDDFVSLIGHAAPIPPVLRKTAAGRSLRLPSLNVGKNVLNNNVEIVLNFVAPLDNAHVAGQKQIDVQIGQRHDAPFQQSAVAAGKIRAADVLLKYHIAAEEDFLCRPVKTDRPRRVSGNGNDPKGLIAQFEPAVLQLHIDLHLRNRHAEQTVQLAADAFEEVHFLAVQGDFYLFLVKKLGALKMIGMRMRVDHIPDVFLLNAVIRHLVEQVRQIAGEAGINQRLYAAADVIAVAVVVKIVCPLININIVPKFHG